MPTYQARERFWREFRKLTIYQQALFLRTVPLLVTDLAAGGRARPSLRMKGVSGYPGIFEMSWDEDGRATFEFGVPVREGHVHVIRRRIGGHEILNDP
jgi:hypothetical protein